MSVDAGSISSSQISTRCHPFFKTDSMALRCESAQPATPAHEEARSPVSSLNHGSFPYPGRSLPTTASRRCILSGGNITPTRFRKLSHRSGRLLRLITTTASSSRHICDGLADASSSVRSSVKLSFKAVGYRGEADVYASAIFMYVRNRLLYARCHPRSAGCRAAAPER